MRIKIRLEDWFSLNGCLAPVSDWSLDKSKFPNGISVKDHAKLISEGYKKCVSYCEKRSKVKDRYDELVSEGVFEPLTKLEQNICRCAGNPENEYVQASRRMLWKKTQKLSNEQLKIHVNINNLYEKFGDELESCVIDIDKARLICKGTGKAVCITDDNEECIVSSCNEDTICLFGKDSVFSLTYEEMYVSIYGNSIEQAKKYIEEE